MRKLLTLLIISISTLNIFAQQIPLTSQYMFNEYILNPGAIGNSTKAELRLSSRMQWINIDGAPVTNYLSFHKLLNNKNMGLAIALYSDNYGPESKVGVKLGYSYIVPVSFLKSNLGMGVFFNGFNYSLDYTKLIPIDTQDPNLQFNKESAFVPDADLGIMLYNNRYSFGISVNQLINSDIKIGDAEFSKNTTARHYLISADYVLTLSEKFDFIPAVLVRFTESSPVQSDIYFRFMYLQKYWVSAAYRTSNTLSLMIGFEYKDFIFGYSYDYDFNDIQQFSSGSHEIVVGYNFSRNFYSTSLSKSLRSF